MRIAVWHNLPSGGGKRALYLHVRGLIQRGHDVEIWTPESGNRSYLPLSDLAPEHVTPFPRLPETAGNPVSDAVLSYRRVNTEIARMNASCAQAAQEMAAGKFDVLFANTCFIYFAPAIGRYAKLPSALYLQEPNRKVHEANPRLPWIGYDASELSQKTPQRVKESLIGAARQRKARLQARYEVQNAAAYDSVLVNSYFSRESLLRCYNIAAQVCYLGIDAANFTEQGRKREDFVVGIGALQAHKNIEFVIEAVGAIPGNRPRLVWVGNMVAPEYKEHLERLAESRKVCLELKVMISDAELVELLNRAMAMVYAPRLEPFGYAPLEANACGLPVIAVAEGGVRETVVDGLNGLLVEAQPEKMAQAIQTLRLDPVLARQLGENGLRRVREHWSLDAATERLEEALTRTKQMAASR